MTFNTITSKKSYLAITLALSTALSLSACQKNTETAPETEKEPIAEVAEQQAAITIKHQLGETVISTQPKKVAALSMNEVDFLDQLEVPISGMPKDFIPHFLSKYKDDASIDDLGSIVQPNMEKVHALHPDFIMMTSLQAQNYEELTKIAPTLHYDVNYKSGGGDHVTIIKDHLLTLGKIFNKEDLAQQKAEAIETKLAEVKKITEGRSEKALVVVFNNGAFSNIGIKSRYGFIFSAFSVKPASTLVETGLHGEPISSEFIQEANPDIIYIIDRTAVMEHKPVISPDDVSNPLIRETKAWKNNRVIFVDADAWYTTSASPTSISLIMDDIMKGYQD